MLTIRLARTGCTKYPTNRVVAAESSRAATGKFVSILGHYNPHTKTLVIKKAEVAKYLQHGAQPSNTMIKLLQREQVELPKWARLKIKQPKTKAAGDKQVAAQPAAQAETKIPDPAPADQAGSTTTAEAVTDQTKTTEQAEIAAAETATE